MYKKNIFITFVFFLLISCSSLKKTSYETIDIQNYQFKKEKVKQLVITGKVNSTQKNVGSPSFKIEIFDKDTFALSLFGPMGMLLIKLYSTENEFIFYNAFTGEAIQGSPNSRSFDEFLPIPVKFLDLISLIRSETPSAENQYNEYSTNNETKEQLFKCDNDKEYVEYIVFDTNTKLLKQVQRKSIEGKETVNVFFRDYSKIDDFYFPKNIIFDIKKENIVMTFDCESYIVNKAFDRSLKFTLPSGVKVNKI